MCKEGGLREREREGIFGYQAFMEPCLSLAIIM